MPSSQSGCWNAVAAEPANSSAYSGRQEIEFVVDADIKHGSSFDACLATKNGNEVGAPVEPGQSSYIRSRNLLQTVNASARLLLALLPSCIQTRTLPSLPAFADRHAGLRFSAGRRCAGSHRDRPQLARAALPPPLHISLLLTNLYTFRAIADRSSWTRGAAHACPGNPGTVGSSAVRDRRAASGADPRRDPGDLRCRSLDRVCADAAHRQPDPGHQRRDIDRLRDHRRGARRMRLRSRSSSCSFRISSSRCCRPISPTPSELEFIKGYNFLACSVMWLATLALYVLGRRNHSAEINRMMGWGMLTLATVMLYFAIGFVHNGLAASIYLRNIVLPLFLFQLSLLTAATYQVRITPFLVTIGVVLIVCGYIEFAFRDFWLAITNGHTFWGFDELKATQSGAWEAEMRATRKCARRSEGSIQLRLPEYAAAGGSRAIADPAHFRAEHEPDQFRIRDRLLHSVSVFGGAALAGRLPRCRCWFSAA